MEHIKADVVIVGAGGAGLRAAIAVAENDPNLKVALISKARTRHWIVPRRKQNNCTPLSMLFVSKHELISISKKSFSVFLSVRKLTFSLGFVRTEIPFFSRWDFIS